MHVMLDDDDDAGHASDVGWWRWWCWSCKWCWITKMLLDWNWLYLLIRLLKNECFKISTPVYNADIMSGKNPDMSL